MFLDEPTTGLDPQTRANLWKHIRALRDTRGATILLTTHYLDEADALCDRILVIDHGKIVAERHARTSSSSRISGDAVALTLDRRRRRRARDARSPAGSRGADAPRSTARAVRVTRRRSGGAGAAADARARRRAASTSPASRSAGPTLDDVFLTLTGRSLRDADRTPEDRADRMTVADARPGSSSAAPMRLLAAQAGLGRSSC